MKVLLLPKNSPWGVIKHPTKGNIYDKVLRFDEDKGFNDPSSLRYKFINKYLLEDGQDWLNLLNLQNEKNTTIKNGTITRVSENKWVFKISHNKYKTLYGLSLQNFLNVDSAIIEDDGEYYFTTVKYLKPGGNGLYVFEFEIDVFFTYQPYKFRTGTTNMVTHGHKDRWELEGNELKPILENLLQPEDNFSLEPTVINTVKIDSNYSIIKNDSGIEEILKNLKIAVFYLRTSTDDLPDLKDTSNLPGKWRREDWASKADDYKNSLGGTFLTSNSVGGTTTTDLPYVIALVPFLQGYSEIKTCAVIANNKYQEFSFDQMYSRYGKGIGTHMEPFSIQVLNYVPGLFEFDYVGNCLYIRSKTEGLKFFFSMDKIPNDTKTWSKCGFYKLNNIHENDASLKEWNSKQTVDTLLNLPEPVWEYINFEGNKTKRSITDIKDIKLEPKLLSPQFRTYRLLEQGGNFVDYSLWELYGITTPLKAKFNLSPENFSMSVFTDQNNVQGGSGNHINKILTLAGVRDIPRQGSSYLQYLNNNQSKVENSLYYAKHNENLAIASSSIGLVGSAVGFGASIAKKSLTGGLGSGAGVGGTGTSLARAILNKGRGGFTEQATQRDLKRQPLIATQIGNKVMSEFMSGPNDIGLFWNIYDLNDNDKQKAFDHLFRYGYTVNKDYDLNTFINSRYYFNFITAKHVFNTIQLEKTLSPTTKQMISDAYSQGITIWHIRDLDTFQGIEVFDKENWETKLLKAGETVSLPDIVTTKEPEREHLELTEKGWSSIEYETYDKKNEIGDTDEKDESGDEGGSGSDVTKSYYIFIPYRQEDQGSTYWRFGLVRKTSGLASKTSLSAIDSTVRLNWKYVESSIDISQANIRIYDLTNTFNRTYDIRTSVFNASSIKPFNTYGNKGKYGFTEYGFLGIKTSYIISRKAGQRPYYDYWGFKHASYDTRTIRDAHNFSESPLTYRLKVWFRVNSNWISMVWYDNSKYTSGGYWQAQKE